MSGIRGRYSAEDVDFAVAMAESIGDKAASRQTGIPSRTIARWKAERRVSVALEPAQDATRAEVAAMHWKVVTEGLAEARRRIRDPNTRAGELAQLIRVSGEQHALLTGGPTANVNERQFGSSFGDAAQTAVAEAGSQADPAEVEEYIGKLARAALNRRDAEEAIATLESGVIPDDVDRLRRLANVLARELGEDEYGNPLGPRDD